MMRLISFALVLALAHAGIDEQMQGIRTIKNALQKAREEAVGDKDEAESQLTKLNCMCASNIKEAKATIEKATADAKNGAAARDQHRGAKEEATSNKKAAISDRNHAQDNKDNENRSFDARQKSLNTDIATAKVNSKACNDAITAIGRDNFLQATAMNGAYTVIRRLAPEMQDSATAMSLLTATSGSGTQNVGAVIGVLKSMKENFDNMASDLSAELKKSTEENQSMNTNFDNSISDANDSEANADSNIASAGEGESQAIQKFEDASSLLETTEQQLSDTEKNCNQNRADGNKNISDLGTQIKDIDAAANAVSNLGFFQKHLEINGFVQLAQSVKTSGAFDAVIDKIKAQAQSVKDTIQQNEEDRDNSCADMREAAQLEAKQNGINQLQSQEKSSQDGSHEANTNTANEADSAKEAAAEEMNKQTKSYNDAVNALHSQIEGSRVTANACQEAVSVLKGSAPAVTVIIERIRDDANRCVKESQGEIKDRNTEYTEFQNSNRDQQDDFQSTSDQANSAAADANTKAAEAGKKAENAATLSETAGQRVSDLKANGCTDMADHRSRQQSLQTQVDNALRCAAILGQIKQD